jgi:hypothetical protein
MQRGGGHDSVQNNSKGTSLRFLLEPIDRLVLTLSTCIKKAKG